MVGFGVVSSAGYLIGVCPTEEEVALKFNSHSYVFKISESDLVFLNYAFKVWKEKV